jgi:hypothetical protein
MKVTLGTDFSHPRFSSWISFGGWISPSRRIPSVFDFDLERWVGEVKPVPSGNLDANLGHAVGRAAWDPQGALEVGRCQVDDRLS